MPRGEIALSPRRGRQDARIGRSRSFQHDRPARIPFPRGRALGHGEHETHSRGFIGLIGAWNELAPETFSLRL